jgi:tetratricopeptide (TPR) repeat protein
MSPRDAEKALPLLAAAPETMTDASILERLDLTRAGALMLADRYEESLAIGQRILGDKARGSGASIVLASLVGLHRYDEARQLLERQLKEPGADPGANETLQAFGGALETDIQRRIAQIEMDQGNIAKAEEMWRKVTASRDANTGDFNNLAWLSLFRGGVTDSDVSVALRAASMSQNRSPSILHTVAALYAEVGKTAEARQVILQSMALSGRIPEREDWYVFGRIYEQLGEREAAIAAYRKVTGPQDEKEPASPTSSATLAERRLKALTR